MIIINSASNSKAVNKKVIKSKMEVAIDRMHN